MQFSIVKKKKRLKLEVSALEYMKGRKSTRAARLAFNKKKFLNPILSSPRATQQIDDERSTN